MTTIIIALTSICTLLMVACGFLSVLLFRERYTIVEITTYNELAKAYNEKVLAEEDNCGGGVGFRVNYDDGDDDEEQIEDKKKKNKKTKSYGS